MCSWDDLRALRREGVSIQSHSVSHRRFSELRPKELDRELVRSRSILEERLGEAVEIFAYPYGDDGRDPQSLAPVLREAGYRAACLYGGGPNRLPPPEPFRLTRLAMGPDSNLEALLC
jgi:peptidoglycan/xylan/chitin deacetylase (PgdA/CDA1 family)